MPNRDEIRLLAPLVVAAMLLSALWGAFTYKEEEDVE